MAFKGTLTEFKVPDILQLISLQKKTGILTFTSDEGFITLIFQSGMIVGVDSFPKKLEMRVGNVLVKQDFISEEMLQRALDIQKRTNQKIGEILIGMGLIGRETIQGSLRIQAIQIVLSLFKWKRGEYNFKIMDSLEEGMIIVEPISTDNLIMEGVQMLDEWPGIKQLIPDEGMIFEPAQVDPKNIEIVSEYEEIPEKEDGKIYLTETETNLLKYINGVNTVQDLVEMGVFTEYKVYKGLSNLVKKAIIKPKTKGIPHDTSEDEADEELRIKTQREMNLVFRILLIILAVILLLRLFNPLAPFSKENTLMKKSLYENAFQTGKNKPAPQ
jgi:hypothetical protein